MASKYYAVKKGKKPGIYRSWNECKTQVAGYSGAVYKSFTSMEEAEKFMGLSTSQNSKSSGEKKRTDDKSRNSETIVPNLEKITAYVDGSYNNAMKVYSGGSVILYKDETIELSKVGNDKELVDMRNVAGELLGVMNVINWIIDRKLKNVTVEFHYDYEGIERWANNEWKANKEGTKDYKKFIADFRELGHELLFVKVKAHSGVFYNEEADRLAGEAIAKYQATGEKEYSSESRSLNNKKKYSDLFEMAFTKVDSINEEDVKTKFAINYNDYILDEKSINKFVKSTWKSKGYLIKDISDIWVEFDVKNQVIKWSIIHKSGEKIADEYKL